MSDETKNWFAYSALLLLTLMLSITNGDIWAQAYGINVCSSPLSIFVRTLLF